MPDISGISLTCSTPFLTSVLTNLGSKPVFFASLFSLGKLPFAEINTSGLIPFASASLVNLSSPVNHPKDLRSICASNCLRSALYLAALRFAPSALFFKPLLRYIFSFNLFVLSSFCNLRILFLLLVFASSSVSVGGVEKPSIYICAECVQLG